MQVLETGTFRIQIRKTHKGRNMYEYMKPFDGITLELRCIGTQRVDETYPGELRLEPVNPLGVKLFQDYCLTWIASGDVVLVEDGM